MPEDAAKTRSCLTPWVENVLRRLYGFPDDEPITEELYDSEKPEGQHLFYGRGYNIGYTDRGCSGYHFGNPIRDRYMTDHVAYLRGRSAHGYSTCFHQWLEEPSDYDTLRSECYRINTQEMTDLLDALAVLTRYEKQCPECMMELGAIINKKGQFAHEPDFKEWVRKREKRGVL